MDEIWTMRDGTKIAVGDMGESHVRNALRMVIRTSRKKKERAFRLLDDVFTEGDVQDMLSSRAYDQLSNPHTFFPLLEGGKYGSAELSARYDPRKR